VAANKDENAKVKQIASQVFQQIRDDCDEPFNERMLFQETSDAEALLILKNMQHRFYNISRIMDCVSCDKCRLNGKVQIRGLATAMKVLFLPDNQK